PPPQPTTLSLHDALPIYSNFSAAAGEVLRRFTGSDSFGMSVRISAGSSKVEPGAQPRRDLVLSWAHFSDAAHEAGLSRRYGGIRSEEHTSELQSLAYLVC